MFARISHRCTKILCQAAVRVHLFTFKPRRDSRTRDGPYKAIRYEGKSARRIGTCAEFLQSRGHVLAPVFPRTYARRSKSCSFEFSRDSKINTDLDLPASFSVPSNRGLFYGNLGNDAGFVGSGLSKTYGLFDDFVPRRSTFAREKKKLEFRKKWRNRRKKRRAGMER